MYLAIYYRTASSYNKYKLAANVIQAHDPFNMIVIDSADKVPGTSSEIKNTFTFADLDQIPGNRAIIKIDISSKSNFDEAVAYFKTNRIPIVFEFYNMSLIVVEIPKGSTYAAFETKLGTSTLAIEYMEADFVHIVEPNYQIPYNEHWHLDNIQAQCAWTAMDPYASNTIGPVPTDDPDDTPTNQNTAYNQSYRPEVALLDGGVETWHPDLVGRATTPVNWNCLDNNSNVLPINSWDNHGTGMAGVIAANNLNNNYTLSLSNDYIRVQVLKIFYNINSVQVYTTIATQLLALSKAMANPRCVAINMSYGGSLFSQAFQDTITYVRTQARNCKGIIAFAATGNSSALNPTIYPALYDNVLGIGGSTTTNSKAFFSNTGAFVFAAAPAQQIVTTDRVLANGYTTTTSSNPTTQYDAYYTNLATYRNFGGTSAACGIASAIAACMVAVNPAISSDQIESIMADTAAQTGGYTYNPKSIELGYGVLRMCDAINEAIAAITTSPDTIDVTASITSGNITTSTCSNITVVTEVTGTGEAWDNAASITIDYFASTSGISNPTMVQIGQLNSAILQTGSYSYTFAVPNISSIANGSISDLIVRVTLYNSCGQVISDGTTEVTDSVSMTIAAGCAAVGLDAAVQILSFQLIPGANNTMLRLFSVKYTNTGTVPITSIGITRGFVGGPYANQTISGANLSTSGTLAPGASRIINTTFNQPIPALPGAYYIQINTVNGVVDSNLGNNYSSIAVTQ